jgi:hypothetical protein
MIARLKQVDLAADDSPGSRARSAEPSMIAEHADIPSLPPAAGTNRPLRNWLILANIVAWIVIIAAIRLIFF